MRFQVGSQGWPVTGQHLVPPSTILDFVGKEEKDLSPWERLAQGKVPPLDVLCLDADAALTLWANYPFHRERVRRQLHPVQEAEFLRLRDDEGMLQRHWGGA